MRQRAISKYIVRPLGDTEYNNKVSLGDKELVLNSSVGVHDHEYVNRIGVIEEVSVNDDLNLKKGDLVAISHNIFRSFMDMQGDIQQGMVLGDGLYFLDRKLIYAVKSEAGWYSIDNWLILEPFTYEDLIEGTIPDEQRGRVAFPNQHLEVGANVWHKVGTYANIDLDGPKRRTTINSILLQS